MTGRAGLWLLACGLAVMAIWAMGVGASPIGMAEVARALWAPTGERNDIVVLSVRLPRVLAAMLVGGALAVAGAIMQAVTANPLAEPGLLGVNAGAAFAVVLAIAFFDVSAAGSLVWAAFAGGAGAAALVYGLGAAGRGDPTPVRLVLAGVVVTTFLAAVTTAVLIFDAQTLDTVRRWTAGSLAGRRMGEVQAVLPYLLIAMAAALLAASQFTTMSLGTDAARSLGQSPALWRGLAALLVVGLAGSSVALAGPLGFVGLMAPHIARMSVGADYRRILPFASLGGAILTLAADTLPRALLGRDVPAGVTLALIGAPFLIWLARRRVAPAR